MNEKKESWLKAIFQYANGQKGRMTASVLLSVVSVIAGLMPFFCIYRVICLFVENEVTYQGLLYWCGMALFSYLIKIAAFSLSTGLSHQMAYNVLEGLRLRVADRLLLAPLGKVQSYTIGQMKE